MTDKAETEKNPHISDSDLKVMHVWVNANPHKVLAAMKADRNTPDSELIERYRKTVGRIFKEIGPDLDDVDVLHDVLKFLRGESQ